MNYYGGGGWALSPALCARHCSSVSFTSFLPWLPHMHSLTNILLNSWGDPLKISEVLSLNSNPLWCSILQTWAALVSLDSELHLLNSGSPLDSTSVPQPGDSLKAVRWAHIICFPSLRNHGPFLSYFQCLENHCFMHFICFSLFQVEE